MDGLLCIVATVRDNMRKILILHGWGQSKDLWEELGGRLKDDGYQVDTVNFPGHGEEPLQSSGWGVPEYAEWLNQKINLQDYHAIIAHSFGGRVVTQTMSQLNWYPEKLILIGTPLVRISSDTKWFTPFIPLAQKVLPPNLQEKLTEKINPEIITAKKFGNYDSYKRIISYDQFYQLESIASQTLLIWGELDKEAPVKIAHICNKQIPNSTLKILPNTGHNIHLEKPLLLYGTIQAFL
jgi:pimeloyl-ACP methyl ester carboxylesterase